MVCKSENNDIIEISRRWDLVLENTIQPSASGAIIYAHHKGIPCVLKLLYHPASDEKLSSKVLSYYLGQGAVKLLRSSENALLLERILPGISLKRLSLQGKDEEATHIFCAVVKKLHTNNANLQDFPTIWDWGQSFNQYGRSDNTRIPKQLVEKAQQIFFFLAESQTSPLLLHGDLHHDNILYDENRGWLALDPKGVVGEAEYEMGCWLRNPMDAGEIVASREVVASRIRIMENTLGFDRQRVMGWAFAQAALAAIWSVEDGNNPDWAIRAAEILLEVWSE